MFASARYQLFGGPAPVQEAATHSALPSATWFASHPCADASSSPRSYGIAPSSKLLATPVCPQVWT